MPKREYHSDEDDFVAPARQQAAMITSTGRVELTLSVGRIDCTD